MKRIVTIITVAATVMTATAFAAAPLKTEQDKLSYAMGYETGRAFKSHQMDVKPDIYMLGMQAGMSGKAAQLSEAEMEKTLAEFQKRNMKKMRETMKKEAELNGNASEAFLKANKAKPDIVSTDSGLQYKVLKAGSGPKPTDKDVVIVNYEGKLLDGKVFDSSYKRGKPIAIPLDGVIKGWQEALTKMPI